MHNTNLYVLSSTRILTVVGRVYQENERGGSSVAADTLPIRRSDPQSRGLA